MRFLFLPLSLSLLALAPASAQLPAPLPSATPAPSSPVPAFPIFRAKLPGGTYEVATRNILSISQHEYVVDGAARVSEVNIDTSGTILVRFYFIEPATPPAPMGQGTATIEKAQQLLTEAADRTGQDAWKKVAKSYPTTTHARTVEYRLTSKEQLKKIFEAAEEAFLQQKAKSVTIE